MWRKNMKQTPQVQPDNREHIKQRAEKFGDRLLNDSPEASKQTVAPNPGRGGRMHREPKRTGKKMSTDTQHKKAPVPRTETDASEEAMKWARILVAREHKKRMEKKKFSFVEMMKKAEELEKKGAHDMAFLLYEQCYGKAKTDMERAVLRECMNRIFIKKGEKDG